MAVTERRCNGSGSDCRMQNSPVIDHAGNSCNLMSPVIKAGGLPAGSIVRCLCSTNSSKDGPTNTPEERCTLSTACVTFFLMPLPPPGYWSRMTGKVCTSDVYGKPTVTFFAGKSRVTFPFLTTCWGRTEPSARMLTSSPSSHGMDTVVVSSPSYVPPQSTKKQSS